MGDVDEMDAEAFVQAYVNIVVGSCISIGRPSSVLIYKAILGLSSLILCINCSVFMI